MLLHGHTQQRRARAATTCRRASQPTENAVIHKPEEVPRAIRDEYEAPREFAATELLLHHLLSVICASTKLSNIVPWQLQHTILLVTSMQRDPPPPRHSSTWNSCAHASA